MTDDAQRAEAFGPLADRVRRSIDERRNAEGFVAGPVPEPTVVVDGLSGGWPFWAADEHVRAIVDYTVAVHQAVIAVAAVTGAPAADALARASAAYTSVEDTAELLRQFFRTSPPPPAGHREPPVRCPSTDPHPPHEHAIIADGITIAGGRCPGIPRRRLRACVEAWPECREGEFDPRCCRFPKSCSCTIYDEAATHASELE